VHNLITSSDTKGKHARTRSVRHERALAGADELSRVSCAHLPALQGASGRGSRKRPRVPGEAVRDSPRSVGHEQP